MPRPSRRSIVLVTSGHDPVGTGRQVEIAATALLEAGDDVHLATITHGGSVPRRLAAIGATIHAVGTRPRADLAAVARIATMLARLRPRGVMAWGRPATAVAALATRSLAAVGRSGRFVAVATRAVHGTADAWALARADRVIAVSSAIAATCAARGVATTRTTIIEPAADAAPPEGLTRDDLAARLRLDPAKRWTLCVAPLVARARLDRLLWAIDQLGVVHRGLEHVLVGSGPNLHAVLRRARVQHLAERLRVVPHCDCLPDLVREAALVWQSGEVAYGGAIFDAMAVGTPVVAVESGAARQAIVPGETGLIVPALPESEFPRRVLAIIEDGELATRLGEASAVRAAAVFPRARLTTALLDAVA